MNDERFQHLLEGYQDHSLDEGEARELLEAFREDKDVRTRFIEELPDHYRRVLRLRFWHHLAYNDIAKETESTPEAVRKVLYRAVEALVDVFKSQTN